jgi:hypothetical protein
MAMKKCEVTKFNIWHEKEKRKKKGARIIAFTHLTLEEKNIM